jgi:hypothetical protein
MHTGPATKLEDEVVPQSTNIASGEFKQEGRRASCDRPYRRPVLSAAQGKGRSSQTTFTRDMYRQPHTTTTPSCWGSR